MHPSDYSNCSTLEEVVNSLYNEDSSEHTILRNDCIASAAKQCTSAMELGIFQGSCLALMYVNLQSPKTLYGVDINTNRFLEGGLKPHFEDYAKKMKVSIPTIIETSSLKKNSVKEVDFLHIDSLHHPKHLTEELKLHAPNIKKYIAFHDINQNNSALGKVVRDFVSKNPKWQLDTYYDKGKCGHALIKRV